jgi:hypothetical protein
MELNRISREEFLKLKEEDLYFITNPGRMGDEDGSTFIVKENNDYKVYRVDGWMYPSKEKKPSECISLDDMTKQFPKWFDTWKNADNKNYHGKYTFIYMGFGNGLCVDNSIYEAFKANLDEKVEEYLEGEEQKESLKYAAIYNVWQNAFLNMINNKKTL